MFLIRTWQAVRLHVRTSVSPIPIETDKPSFLEFRCVQQHDHSKVSVMSERRLRGLWNRVLQILARVMPGATSERVRLNRSRGVHIGKDVWIGYDAIIETSHPHLVTIHDDAAVGIRARSLPTIGNNEAWLSKKMQRLDQGLSCCRM
jgi:hypothetical protein